MVFCNKVAALHATPQSPREALCISKQRVFLTCDGRET